MRLNTHRPRSAWTRDAWKAAHAPLEAIQAVRDLLASHRPTAEEYRLAVRACRDAGLASLGDVLSERRLWLSLGLPNVVSIADVRAAILAAERGEG
jgi:hypothetical protein